VNTSSAPACAATRERVRVRHGQTGIARVAAHAVDEDQVAHAFGKLERVQDRDGRALGQPAQRDPLGADGETYRFHVGDLLG
jgi:hypothetical protein